VLIPLLIAGFLMASVCGALALGVGWIYARGILPQVHAAGINLGGQSIEAAAETLRAQWNALILRDGERTWSINPAQIGITLDARATAEQAYAQGRTAGGALQAVFNRVDVPPVVNIDIVTAAVSLDQLAAQFDIPAVNAGIRLTNGLVTATPPQEGRRLDVVALITRLDNGGAAAEAADGVIDLPMRRVVPTVTDATPLLALASNLLRSPLHIRAYDPIDHQRYDWSLPPEQWSLWLNTEADPASSLGLRLALDDRALRNYLTAQASTLNAPQTLRLDEAVTAVQAALAAQRTEAEIRIYHQDTRHVVRPGETLISIAWDYGVPYPWIQQANPGLGDMLAVGQTLTIPSPDNFLEFPVVSGKRIEVSISQQRVRVYENDQLKWDWLASTGIASSPTWPGVYQIISHEPNAYAANWNLWMPHFLGVYRPIPGQAFTNGFHGFPTRGGSQLLWTNNLGTRVTYGCILLSSANAALLYDWAENGVVVEILP
jgi:LysM repeat protein